MRNHMKMDDLIRAVVDSWKLDVKDMTDEYLNEDRSWWMKRFGRHWGYICKSNLDKLTNSIQDQDKKLSNFLTTQLNTQASMLQLTTKLTQEGVMDAVSKKHLKNFLLFKPSNNHYENILIGSLARKTLEQITKKDRDSFRKKNIKIIKKLKVKNRD